MTLNDNEVDGLTVAGGVAAVLDTLVGAVVSLGLDLSRKDELIFAISMVLGVPAYLLDARTKLRIPIFLLGLFLLRWSAQCFLGSHPTLTNPVVWPVGDLLLTALLLLQASKLRRSGKGR